MHAVFHAARSNTSNPGFERPASGTQIEASSLPRSPPVGCHPERSEGPPKLRAGPDHLQRQYVVCEVLRFAQDDSEKIVRRPTAEPAAALRIQPAPFGSRAKAIRHVLPQSAG